ncbi:hypothetical protein ABBQ38_014167 [Trebouxia sp. C0009 RCD-2024]
MSFDDLWFARDKVEHFICCAVVACLAYLAALYHPRCVRYRLPLSALCSVLGGLLKEAGDYLQWWPGLLSVKDLAADLFGTVFALSALVTYEAIWGRPFATRPGSSSVV